MSSMKEETKEMIRMYVFVALVTITAGVFMEELSVAHAITFLLGVCVMLLTFITFNSVSIVETLERIENEENEKTEGKEGGASLSPPT